MRRLRAAAVASSDAARGARAAHQPETEMFEDAAQRLGVVMLGDDGAAWDVARINSRQEKELAVPQCDDRGVEALAPLHIVRRVGDDGRGVHHQLDVVDDDRRDENLQRAPQANPLPPEPRIFPKRRHYYPVDDRNLPVRGRTIATKRVRAGDYSACNSLAAGRKLGGVGGGVAPGMGGHQIGLNSHALVGILGQ